MPRLTGPCIPVFLLSISTAVSMLAQDDASTSTDNRDDPKAVKLANELGDVKFGENGQVVSLIINRAKLSDHELAGLESLKNLEYFSVHSYRFRGHGLRRIRGIASLTGLSLYCPVLTDKGLSSLDAQIGWKNLKRLRIICPEISDAGLIHIRGLTGLQSLSIDHGDVTDEGIANFSEMAGLERLELNSTKVTGTGLKHLKRPEKLKTLKLYRSPINDEGLKEIGSFVNLEWLYLTETNVTDRGLTHLKSLKKLRRLDLDATKVTDKGLAELGHLPIEELSLSCTSFSSRGVGGVIVSSTSNAPQITDVGLVHLRGLMRLRKLDLQGTTVTGEGVKTLRSTLPDLKVIHGFNLE